ncbi:hypothetical protein AgCh_020895 [Apium graveolens]
MKARYFPHTDFLNAKLGKNPSYMWRSIITAQDVVRKGCRRSIGTGKDTFVWKIPWLSCIENGYVTIHMPIELENIRVCDLMEEQGKKWDDDNLNDLFEDRDVCLIKKIPLSISNITDTWMWIFEEKGEFTVKSCYRSLVGEYDKSDVVGNKDAKHVLFECTFAQSVWRSAGMSQWVQIMQGETIFEHFKRLFTTGTKEQCISVALFCWSIWNRRNEWVWSRIDVSVFGTMNAAINLLGDWKTAQVEREKVSKSSNGNGRRWQAPSSGWVKLNIDAAVLGDIGAIGVGGVIRDEHGGFVKAMCKKMAGRSYFHFIVKDCVDLFKHFDEMLVHFVRRVRGVGSFVNPSTYFNLPKGKDKKSRVSKAEFEQTKNDFEKRNEDLMLQIAELKNTMKEMASAAKLHSPMLSDKASCRVEEKEGVAEMKQKCGLTVVRELMVENNNGNGDDYVDINHFDPPPGKKDPRKYELAVDVIENKVAFGMVFSEDGMSMLVHGVPLEPGYARVQVDGTIKEDASVPVPIAGEIETVRQVVGSFVAWPKNLIIFSPPTAEKKKEVKPRKTKIVNAYQKLSAEMKSVKPTDNVPRRYLYTEVRKRKLSEMYAFVDPAATFKLNDDFEAYIVERMNTGDSLIFLMPHNEKAVRSYNAQKGLVNKNPKIKNLSGSPKQPGGYECGYVVMRYMKDIFEDKKMKFITKWAAMTQKCYTKEELDEVRFETLQYVQEFV